MPWERVPYEQNRMEELLRQMDRRLSALERYAPSGQPVLYVPTVNFTSADIKFYYVRTGNGVSFHGSIAAGTANGVANPLTLSLPTTVNANSVAAVSALIGTTVVSARIVSQTLSIYSTNAGANFGAGAAFGNTYFSGVISFPE
jgi:hypothetical protein